jgi:hypothetical protein
MIQCIGSNKICAKSVNAILLFGDSIETGADQMMCTLSDNTTAPAVCSYLNFSVRLAKDFVCWQ